MREKMTRIPLSEEAKAAGCKWMMMDGVKTEEEARRLERIFVKHVKELKKMSRLKALVDKAIDELEVTTDTEFGDGIKAIIREQFGDLMAEAIKEAGNELPADVECTSEASQALYEYADALREEMQE